MNKQQYYRLNILKREEELRFIEALSMANESSEVQGMLNNRRILINDSIEEFKTFI